MSHRFGLGAVVSSDPAIELQALRAIVEGTAQEVGDQFFHSLVENVCRALGAESGFIAQFAGQRDRDRARVRTIANFKNGQHVDNMEWDLEGTPCQRVVEGELCYYASDVHRLFPKEEGVESYIGVPLFDSEKNVAGHLAVYDSRPMPETPRLLLTFRIFSARATAELERIRTIERLRLAEERYRDLFQQAPIAYVLEDIDSNFVSANDTALRVLGVRPEEVKGMRGKDLAPPDDEAQKLLNDAFAVIEHGDVARGLTLELRRKDNGKPVWIQWWSSPDVGQNLTRTMFIDITDRVMLEREQARLRAQNQYLQDEIKSLHNFQQIIGNSRSLQAVLESVARVAPTDASVLIQGETGTGKELITRAIHAASKRHDKPLIKVNCAALPQNLIESELFGHEKGAFTGATTRRIGRFELAEGGTIFLDEVGEVPLDVQVKLLRVLQEREIERVGSSTPIPINVRVFAATNRDLKAAIKDKTFREDLFYRLNVFPVYTPPLRDRVEDIPALVQHTIAKFAAQIGRRIDSVSEESMRRLQGYPWPGNVRELQNVIERAIILSDSPILEVEFEGALGSAVVTPATPTGQAPSYVMQQTPADEQIEDEHLEEDQEDEASSSLIKSDNGAAQTSLEAIERQHILNVLEQKAWVIEGPKGAAAALDMRASTLRHRMQKLGIARRR